MKTIILDELQNFHEHGVYTPARIIELFGEIDEEKANQFVKNIRILDFTNNNDIIVLINTPGGDAHQGLAIYDAIKECQSKVTTHAVGPCWSMGAAILQAGDRRVISKNSTVMIHTGESNLEDHNENFERWWKEYKRIGEIYENILYCKIKEKKKRFTREKLKTMLTFDSILTADKIIEYNLAEEIAEHREF